MFTVQVQKHKSHLSNVYLTEALATFFVILFFSLSHTLLSAWIYKSFFTPRNMAK